MQTSIKTLEISRKKNQFIKLLEDDFPSVVNFLDAVGFYEMSSVYWLSLVLFIGGIALSILIEISSVQAVLHFFGYAIDPNYIRELLKLSPNTSPNTIALIGAVLGCLCSFLISILVIIAIFYLWVMFTTLKRLCIVKRNKEEGLVEFSSLLVYPSYWAFIGFVIGLNITIFFYFIVILSNLSTIDNNFSFNETIFDLIYADLLYSEFYVSAYLLGLLYLSGLLASFILIFVIYYFAKNFKKRAVKSITNSYKHNFPYVKIKTESGEVEGQLQDIINKNLVTLNKNNELKIVPWDKIQIMEATSNPNETEESMEFISLTLGWW
jgi:hypothetical protein